MAKPFNPGGHKGKLHREMGVPEDPTIRTLDVHNILTG